MMRLWAVALIVSLVALLLAPSEAARPPDTIIIRIRSINMVCLGLCPDFSVSIAPNGVVTQRNFELGSDHVIGTERYRLSVSERTDLTRRLDKLRPIGDRQFGRACDAYPMRGADNKRISGRLLRGASHYDIQWRGSAAPSRLRACFEDERVRHAVFAALAVVRINPISGRRLKAGEIASIAEW
ncbi:MAG: hypothetical protein WC729_24335 [Sphingomonas sp.]|jgi:hypothetical protein|uniref:hypothetical protein n=1 Tax=Sphingomonas sp. TaxID=28214 RepID=UPI003562EA38